MPQRASKAPAKVTKRSATTRRSAKPRPAAAAKTTPGGDSKLRLLSGGNPQIAKGDGDAPVQAYLAAMPGWKREVGRRLDALVERAVPGVRKAVRWNTPFYGVDAPDAGWFMAFHCITKYVKVTFFRGTSLKPLPPVTSKVKNVRYFHVYENGEFDEKLVASWIKQAAGLPGENCF